MARPTTATEQAGSWLVTTETSPIDDSTNVYVSVEAEGTIPNTFGFPVRPALVVRCKENTTSALINWKVFLDIEATPITYRNDNAPAEDSVWSVSTNHEAAGLWQGGEAIHFIRRPFGHHQLLARVTPYGANPVTATFSISGLEEAINPLREACHW